MNRGGVSTLLLDLKYRTIDGRLGFLARIVPLDIADNADDLDRLGVINLSLIVETERATDRVLILEVFLGERLIDDCDSRGGCIVAQLDLAASQKRRAKRFGVLRSRQ